MGIDRLSVVYCCWYWLGGCAVFGQLNMSTTMTFSNVYLAGMGGHPDRKGFEGSLERCTIGDLLRIEVRRRLAEVVRTDLAPGQRAGNR